MEPFHLCPAHFYAFRDELFEVTFHEPARPTRGVPEALVHDLWRYQRFRPSALLTKEDRRIEVLSPGIPNADSGPDFLQARIRIGEILWAGDVEIHVTSGDWYGHRHHHDPTYNGVVLHVTLFSDIWTGKLQRQDGTLLPELSLYKHLDTPLHRLLHQFLTRAPEALPCESVWPRLPLTVIRLWIGHLAQERLEANRRRLENRYLENPDLEALLHERLFEALGYAKNAEPMSALARRLPLARLRGIEDPRDLEALHFGMAGLLPTPADLNRTDRATTDYVMTLRERFEMLRRAFDAPPMEHAHWRFFRLRPANFPTLRIAQGVAMIHELLRHDPIGTLLEALRREDPVIALRNALRNRPSPFWDRHYRLERSTRPRDPSLGSSRVDAMLINAVLPVLYLLAEQQNDPRLEARIEDVLRRLPPENDLITRRFGKMPFGPRTAFLTQGVHQLYRTRCEQGGCLSCRVGQFMLGSD